VGRIETGDDLVSAPPEKQSDAARELTGAVADVGRSPAC
jgi:hypothetical protein